MRGKATVSSYDVRITGITPAHAGKSYAGATVPIFNWDHPRACGEKTQEVTKYKAYDILHA